MVFFFVIYIRYLIKKKKSSSSCIGSYSFDVYTYVMHCCEFMSLNVCLGLYADVFVVVWGSVATQLRPSAEG